jgi:membrane peptidoglycan carboxypeptidase
MGKKLSSSEKIRSNKKMRSGTGNKRRKRRFFKLKWLLCLFVLGVIASGLGYFVFEVETRPFKDRAEIYDLRKIDDVEVKSLILDHKGREIGRIFVENRDKISIKDVPRTMINALVAGEDQRYFEHDGVDRVGIVRALYLNLRAGRQTQGASTLTQQLARNAFHLKEEADKRGEGGLERKAVEAFLAMRIEKVYSKPEILEFYLNRIPFGSGFYGIRSAALGYFGKEPRDLTTLECASLVGCIKNPTRISPINNPGENKKARNQVLRRMMAEGYLLASEGEKLQQEAVVVNSKPIRRGTSHLYDRIANSVRERLGEDELTEGGFQIHTSIDRDVQWAMEKGLLKQLASTEAREEYPHPSYVDYRKEDGKPAYLQCAGLMIDNASGAVIAYVGGRDFTHNQYDFVQSGRKPIGTAFFPFIGTAALEQKMSPVSRMIDRPMDNRAVMVDGREGILGEWGMETLTPDYEGDISMRRALDVSKIAASVRLGKKLGLETVMETARKFGLSFPETKLLARMLVGTADVSLPELVHAYASFPNGGVLPPSAYFIDRIVDSAGATRYKVKARKGEKRVTREETAFLMHTMLQSALRNGTGPDGVSTLADDASLAGKTGTTYDFADNWFVGYNSNVTCGVWAGFLHGSRNAIYPGAFSRETVMPAWVDTMNAANKEFAGKAIQAPEAVVRLEICKNSGLRKTRYCQEHSRDVVSGAESYSATILNEYFLKGSEPTGYCDVHGVVDPALGGSHNFGADGSLGALSHAIPIQPTQPLLLGQDPYGSEQPDFAPRDTRFSRGDGRAMNFDQLDEEDSDAAIILERPRRIEIHEE